MGEELHLRAHRRLAQPNVKSFLLEGLFQDRPGSPCLLWVAAVTPRPARISGRIEGEEYEEAQRGPVPCEEGHARSQPSTAAHPPDILPWYIPWDCLTIR
jgi:hypothetical protein